MIRAQRKVPDDSGLAKEVAIPPALAHRVTATGLGSQTPLLTGEDVLCCPNPESQRREKVG